MKREARVARHRSAARSLAAATSALVKNHEPALDQFEAAAADSIREKMWKDVYEVFKAVSEFGDSWNDLSYDISSSD